MPDLQLKKHAVLQTFLRSWPGVLLILLTLLVLLRTAWVCDDAFISYTASANLMEGKGFTFQPGTRLQTYSNPLWTLIVAVAYGFTDEVWLTGIFLCIGFSLATTVLLHKATDGVRWKVLALGAMLLLSSSFVDFSTSGLENALSHFLLLVFAGYFLKEQKGLAWLRNLILLTSLLLLNRLDFLLLTGPACAFAFWTTKEKRRWGAIVLGLLPILLWEGFSLIYYGFLLPNTWYAKLGVGDGRWLILEKGMVYFWNCLRLDTVTILVILSAMIAAGWGRNRKLQLLMSGAFLYTLGVLSAGGDYMQGRMFSVVFVLSLFVLLHASLPKWWLATAALFSVIGLLRADCPLYSGPNYHAGRIENTKERYRDMITDERALCWKSTGLWSNHGAEKHPMLVLEQRADANRDGDLWQQPVAEVRMVGAIGMRGYEATPGLHWLDEQALGEPLLARLPALETRWWRAGHRPRVVPAGYKAHLKDPASPLEDQALQVYVQQLELVTKGPIWSSERWAAIWGFLTGKYASLRDDLRYRKGFLELEKDSPVFLLENPVRAVRWRPIRIRFTRVQHARSLKFRAKSGGELWAELYLNGAALTMAPLKSTLLQDHGGIAQYEFRLPATGFDILVLRGEALSPDLVLYSGE